jgi:hypothetical protein
MRRLFSRLLWISILWYVAWPNLTANEQVFEIPDGIELFQPFQLGVINGPHITLDWRLSTTQFTSPWAAHLPLWVSQKDKTWALSSQLYAIKKNQKLVSLSNCMSFFSIPKSQWQEIPITSRMTLILISGLLGLGTLALSLWLPKSLSWVSISAPVLLWSLLPDFARTIYWPDGTQTWACHSHLSSNRDDLSITQPLAQTLRFSRSPSQQILMLSKNDQTSAPVWFENEQLRIYELETKLWGQILRLEKK